MANFVTKKDATKAPFEIEKIKHAIVEAARESELSEEEAANIAQEIATNVSVSFEGMEEVSSEEIREKIVSELDALAPAVGEAWRKYEEGKHE